MVALAARLDQVQRRRPMIGFPIAVFYKYFDDQGAYLAALITYYTFLSLFPLLLLLVTILGFLLSGHPDWQEAVIGSALAQFPIIGDQLRTDVQPLKGNTFALVTGILIGLYGSLGVARALQNALDTVWAVPRRARPNPIVGRIRSLGLVGVFGLGVLLTTVLASVTSGTDELGAGFGLGIRLLAVVVALAGNAVLLVVVFRLLTAYPATLRDIWVGAVVGACGWQAFQLLGTYYLTNRLRGATQVYGLFGLVLGLMGWLFLLATMIVFAMEINVVRARKLYPRSLLTPFLDDVDLTESDERAYTSYARAEQFKASQRVDVTFEPRRPAERIRARSTHQPPSVLPEAVPPEGVLPETVLPRTTALDAAVPQEPRP